MKTKAEEIEVLKKFAAGLKDCPYLNDYFKDLVPQIEDAIRSDFCAPSFSALDNAKRELVEENRRLTAEKYKTDRELETSRLKLRQSQDQLSQIKELAERVATLIRGY